MWWLVVLCVLILATAAWGGKSAAIWVPAGRGDAERAMVFAGVSAGDVVYDLGCGDGRMVEAAAARGARAIGYEISLLPFVLAQLRRLRSPYKERMSIRYHSFWSADLSDATHIYAYLMPKIYPKLLTRLRDTCRPGTILLTYVWGIDGKEALAVDSVEGCPKIWKYRV